MTKTLRRAGIYARLSLDKYATGLAVERQIGECRDKATALGWPVVDTYVDNDVSASSTKRRPEYERLLADLENGRINAVVVYDIDRLTRRPMELEHFIDLTERLGISLSNIAGDIDLSTSGGRGMARMKGVWARMEVEKLGERLRDQKKQRLAEGKPPGGRYRTFGYTRAWEPIPDEAVIVGEVFDRIAKGESMSAVTKDLCSRNVKRVSGEPWAFQATSRMLRSQIYAGYVGYKGQRGAKSSVPALVDDALFDTANAVVVRRPGGRPNTRQTLLSGIAVCDACKTPMIGSSNNGSPIYTCDRQRGGCGNIRIRRAWLDDLIADNIWQVLAHDYKNWEASPRLDVEAQVAALDERIVKTQQALTNGALSYEDGLPMLADLRSNKEALKDAQKATSTFHAHLVDFRNADVSRQSAEVRRHVSVILVKPTQNRGNTKFDPSRFDVVLKSGEVVPGPAFVDEGFSRVVRVFAGSKPT